MQPLWKILSRCLVGSAYLLLVASFVSLLLFQHLRAAYGFPTPWPDESYFLWQSIGFAEHNALFSRVINPERTIFWMPPGFLVVVGLIFKLTGVSLAAARAVSFVSLVASFVALAAIVRQHSLSHMSLVLIGLIFLGGQFIAAGNVARPDALLLALMLSGFLLIFMGRWWGGLAVLAVSPLVHPNGFLFLVAAAGHVGILLWRGRRIVRPSRCEWLLIALVTAFWLGYVVYAWQNWPDFTHDMLFQIHRKAGRDLWDAILAEENLFLMLSVTVLLVYSALARLQVTVYATIALPAWFIFLMGHEMWYDIYRALAYGLFSLMALHAVRHLLSTRLPSAAWRPLFGATVILLLAWHGNTGTIPTPSQIPVSPQWYGMTIPESVPYISDSDVEAVGLYLKSCQVSSETLTVQFLPRADAFLFPQVLSGQVQVVHSLFCELPADLYIFHRSRYIPSWWRFYISEDLKKIGRSTLADDNLIFARDSTEKWYVVAPVAAPQ